MKYTNKDLILAHKFSVNNKPQIDKDSKCGCFYCQRIFSTSEFTEDDWLFCPGEEQGTAICPHCMVDSIISESSGYPITEDFLSAMYEFWFGPNGVDFDEEKAAELDAMTEDESDDAKDVLIVVDMQNDFIDGALGTAEAVAIVPAVKEKIENFDGIVLFTRDTHESYYLDTQEGKNLPVPHCIRGTDGWQIRKELDELRTTDPIDKETFGSSELGGILCDLNENEEIRSITFVGLCTDICVISNVMIAKAFLPEVPIIVDASCCAGVTPQSHETALKAMEACQVKILR